MVASADYRLGSYVADTDNFLSAVVDRPCVVVGHSLGAFVGLALAARRPSLVSAYVAIDATPLIGDDEKAKARQIVSFMQARDGFDGWDEAVEYSRNLSPGVATGSLRRSLESQLRATPSGRLVWKHDQRDLQTEAGLDDLIAAIRDLVPAAGKIECPALVVRGGRSLSMSAARAFAELLPRARTVTIEDAGHNVHSEKPEELAESLYSFFKSWR